VAREVVPALSASAADAPDLRGALTDDADASLPSAPLREIG
jgi:hypothetical protein